MAHEVLPYGAVVGGLRPYGAARFVVLPYGAAVRGLRPYGAAVFVSPP